MSIKDLFRLLIKIVSLYFFIITAYSSLPTLIVMAIGEKNPYSQIALIVSIIASILFFLVLILKADWIIQVLKLDSGFDDENIKITDIRQRHIFDLAIIVIGGVLFLSNLSVLITNIVIIFKYTTSANGGVSEAFEFKNELQVGMYFLNTIIGYLIITNHHKIGRLIERISEKEDKKNEG